MFKLCAWYPNTPTMGAKSEHKVDCICYNARTRATSVQLLRCCIRPVRVRTKTETRVTTDRCTTHRGQNSPPDIHIWEVSSREQGNVRASYLIPNSHVAELHGRTLSPSPILKPTEHCAVLPEKSVTVYVNTLEDPGVPDVLIPVLVSGSKLYGRTVSPPGGYSDRPLQRGRPSYA